MRLKEVTPVKVCTTYSVKIKHYNHIFKDTLAKYRSAVDYLIGVCLDEWEAMSQLNGSNAIVRYTEILTHATKSNPNPKYDFDRNFYKFPSYLRRAAIMDAYGHVSSYKSNLKRYPHPEKCALPNAGFTFPVMYHKECYMRDTDNPYKARIKVFVRNTWDWLDIELKKGDVDYILHHCANRKECSPSLVKRGKEYFLSFPFEEKVSLRNTDVREQIAVAVDLGINSACTCSVMRSSGTILDRRFLNLSKEEDSLRRTTNRIKKAQRMGAKRTPKLWAAAKGINDRIAVLTANFIMQIAVQWNADVIVFEHLDLQGKKSGASKKLRLHLWKAQYVQSMVTIRAHRHGMRVNHVNAKWTSQLAYDGSGKVERDKRNYSICKFQNGKIYNCDLSASYNIGARYFVKELIKPLRETVRFGISAKVPECAKRTTVTLATLINLNAVLAESFC